ncbi:hypothetical protein Vadar_019559 [Vaccinium darrowii]|uniref:Uncharacterized protein n=1 Tax=Vaccinium darrowii TaxID=229202 RepID=A0ACB7XT14_9ERIC|nr:hypothetical protein Vadar_019559 [Vaccinium darrowii]
MAGGGEQLRYAKLTPDEQGPFEEIRPGELNQPIDVPRLLVRKCNHCQQPLPENFVPITDEPWTTGIFGCAEDPDSCWTGLLCPCVLFGRNVERLSDGSSWIPPCVCHAFFCEGGIALAATATALAFHGIDISLLSLSGVYIYACLIGVSTFAGTSRLRLQRKYHLKDSPCVPSMVHCCLHWCALCQEHREMKERLSDKDVALATVVDPPQIQEMINTGSDNIVTAPSSSRSVEHNNLEITVP